MPRPGPPQDRRCFGRLLNNSLRRWLAPPVRELEVLRLRAGQVVADLGAGSGFFTLQMLTLVGPTGRVFAVERSASAANRPASTHPAASGRLHGGWARTA